MRKAKRDDFQKIAVRILKAIPAEKGGGGRKRTVEVTLLPNRTLRLLKRKFLKQDRKVVDVLAFPEPLAFPRPDRGREKVLGEVCLNAEIAARDRDRAVALLAHGIAHLLGYRHATLRDTIRMTRIERHMLERIGYAHQ